jgi:hypothetical protein
MVLGRTCQSYSAMDKLEEQEWYLDERYYHKREFILNAGCNKGGIFSGAL